jgi:hypothetical protein
MSRCVQTFDWYCIYIPECSSVWKHCPNDIGLIWVWKVTKLFNFSVFYLMILNVLYPRLVWIVFLNCQINVIKIYAVPGSVLPEWCLYSGYCTSSSFCSSSPQTPQSHLGWTSDPGPQCTSPLKKTNNEEVRHQPATLDHNAPLPWDKPMMKSDIIHTTTN